MTKEELDDYIANNEPIEIKRDEIGRWVERIFEKALLWLKDHKAEKTITILCSISPQRFATRCFTNNGHTKN